MRSDLFDRIKTRVQEVPVDTYAQADLEVHSLLGTGQIWLYLYAIKTFLTFSRLPCIVKVHNDGTLTHEEIALLNQEVPGIQILFLKELPPSIAAYTQCVRFFEGHLLGRRFFSICCQAETEKILILDSDVLFLKPPTEIIRWVTDPEQHSLYNQDSSATSADLERDACTLFDYTNIPFFNAGLLCTHKSLIDIDITERVLEHLSGSSRKSKQWTWDQRVWAVLVSRAKHRPLPETYSFVNSLEGAKQRQKIEEVISRHYSYPKWLFFSEGARYLLEADRWP